MKRVLSVLGLLLVATLALCSGAIWLTPARMLTQLLQSDSLVVVFRLPRLLVAMMAGVNLAVAGTLLQALMRNPLASPDLVGITTGAGVAAVAAILLGWNFNSVGLPLISFLGAAIAGLAIYKLGQGGSGQRLILCGVALASLGQALITLLLVNFAPSAAEAMIWLKGSLYARGWSHVKLLAPWFLLGLAATRLAGHQLNTLLLGEETIVSLGMEVDKMRRRLLLLAVLLAASAVSMVGTIGFVGLLVPHLARMLSGPDHRVSLPTIAMLGAALLALADTLGRVLAPPLEIPAGIITAVVGAPYFGYLLLRRSALW